MIAETIHWHDAEDVLPRGNHMVLVEVEGAGVTMARLGLVCWLAEDHGTLNGKVISWAEMPKGMQVTRMSNSHDDLAGHPRSLAADSGGCGCTNQNRDWNCKLHN